jgi:glycosyltransferase involved in cell wall biosynthesis
VEEGRNAILVKPASPVELVSAIRRILEDRQTALAYGARSREIFEEKFTLEQGMVRLMMFYHQVMSLH